jgi:3-oxo-5-alpha-steroid 4-dehydrogenase 1
MNFFSYEFYTTATRVVILVAAIVFPALLIINAPYGRHLKGGWGPEIPARLCWVLMEVPAPICFAVAYFTGPNAWQPFPLFFFLLFQAHYVHRSIIYPLLARNSQKRSAAVMVLLALTFNTVNGWMCGLAVSHFGSYGPEWLWDPRFLFGTLLFFAGAAINLHSDSVLRNLRAPGESGYRIPHGGFYRWISSPNYFGEILEWLGWALATWSTAGLAFALFTMANLAPRARSNHAWYRETFEDYPERRRALIPGLY